MYGAFLAGLIAGIIFAMQLREAGRLTVAFWFFGVLTVSCYVLEPHAVGFLLIEGLGGAVCALCGWAMLRRRA